MLLDEGIANTFVSIGGESIAASRARCSSVRVKTAILRSVSASSTVSEFTAICSVAFSVVYRVARTVAAVAAASMTLATSFGCDTKGTWLDLISVVAAPMRLA
jgi:hexokinase